MKNQKIILLSFATKNLVRSSKRLRTQAEKLKIYDEIIILNEDAIISSQKEIIEYKRIAKNNKGYGFWFWKPYLVLDILNKLQEGDIIHYLDVGCHLNVSGIKRFKEYIDVIKNSEKGVLAFQYNPLNYKKNKNIIFPSREEFKYTKSDLFEYFSVLKDQEITHTPQFWSGSFFIKKNKFSLDFCEDWLDVVISRFDLINDSISIKKNFSGFIENRHDQSVFSIMCKKKQIKKISAYECDWAYLDNQRTWTHLEDQPIVAKRDLTYNIFRRFVNRQKKTLRRLKLKFVNWRDGRAV